MMRRLVAGLFMMKAAFAVPQLALAAPYRLADVTVVAAEDSPAMVKLAADEIRNYVFRLTGSWAPPAAAPPKGKPAIVLRTGQAHQVPVGGPDPSQNFALYVEDGAQIVHGASDRSTLWAAYQLIESWGAGFYLGGDALPPADSRKKVEPVTSTHRPSLAIRGNLPWFNFLNSPTTWNPQDYKTFFAQMAKQKASFIGFHAYDHEPFGGYDISSAGATMGGPLMTTISPHRWWSPHAMCTKDHLFGTDQFFNRGEWGCEVGIDDAWANAPGRATRLQQQMMAEALACAQRLGIRTCLGWEVTGNPSDPATKEAFRKRLAHTLATYPLDYFWAWQSEGRGTAGDANNPVAGAPNDKNIVPDAEVKKAFAYLGPNHDLREAKRITEYVLLAHATLKEFAPNVRLIVSGWGGDAWMRFSSLYEGLDKLVPQDVIFSSLDNIDPRLQDHVAEVYGKVQPSRERWPIPWFESDGGHARCDQTGPQTNVTGFEPLLKDTVKKGCQGVLGIHWRTRNVEDVAGYLYRFGWNAELSAADFFRQYSRDHYGAADAEYMAKIHLRLEEFGPQYVGAVGCVECSTPFAWFSRSGSATKGGEPNHAGHLPDARRFGELEKMIADLAARASKAAADSRTHAAMQYQDLGNMIRWLVTRAQVGLAIWNDTAPLEKRLRRAERLFEKRQFKEARDEAAGILKELEAFNFQGAFQGFAATCRTRGELGMLTTANARYGRFYAAFVQRIAHILGKPLPAVRGPEPWTGPAVLTVYPVPNHIGSDETVSFDAVLLPRKGGQRFVIDLAELGGRGRRTLPMELLGGSYYRAVFFPPGEGAWAWKLALDDGGIGSLFETRSDLPCGVVTIGPAAGAVKPSYAPPRPIVQMEPVLKIDFDRPLAEIGEVVGKATLVDGVRGKALDTNEGGFLRIGEASKPVAFKGPFAISFFAKPAAWDKDKTMPVLLSKGVWDANGWYVQMVGGAIRVYVGPGRCLDAGMLEVGRWTHVAVNHDGRELQLYVDGELAGRAALIGPSPSDQPLRIGDYREPVEAVYAYHGCIDEITFYNRALEPEEIEALSRR